ncbi:WD40 repeat-like protein [Xylona heveae TC161]|uniref:WD40 repeat-like protein n=1 Tax=Xylona heveae (strain CBS 132557 / TC161) TaxID=1328760 RepID=A0A165JR12_XYLHT|nr:WD40 repeat-like protein [Xylona heveae TC161]KZF26528.1 WD40 repeat-like protein [Xylona heveae TC161]
MDEAEANVSSPIERLSEQDVFSPENLMSSPLSSKITGANSSGKPKRPPPITPNSFRRFFTPRSSQAKGTKVSASRKALQDITNPARNSDGSAIHRPFPGPELFRDIPRDASTAFDFDFTTPTSQKKRGFLISPDSSPEHASPSKRQRNLPLNILEDEEPAEEVKASDATAEKEQIEKVSVEIPTPTPIRRRLPNINGRIYQRSLGPWGSGRPFRHLQISCNWQYETAAFYTAPEDRYDCRDADDESGVLPFCTASCNTNSLVAIGDEEGRVRLLESAPDSTPEFSSAFLEFYPHENAILDLAFSSDDLLLATGSGDQTARIIDMSTQRPIYSLAGHSASVKQVRFQPGSNNNVIATSSRDGTVHIWDLRCKAGNSSVRQVHVSLDPDSTGAVSTGQASHCISRAQAVNSIFEAHANRPHPPPAGSSVASALTEGVARAESIERRGDVSVTALSFLNPGREHLLLTASEANATVKLWDLRTTYSHRRGRTAPLSTTCQPDSHNTHRHFGINSLTLNGDGSRLYSLCRDNTIYAYSTSHLVLGNSPELSSASSKPRRAAASVGKEGLGPLYGFRHPQLHATTFYVKTALRPASGDQPELLAVGSSDGCAVLFPTDERHLTRTEHLENENGSSSPLPLSNTPTPPATPRPWTRSPGATMSSGLASRLNDTIPIYRNGSALVHGHSREVTSLTWSSRGELVTVGDDMLARCWREGPKAKELRRGDEADGRLWNYGWAEAEPGFDDDSDDE